MRNKVTILNTEMKIRYFFFVCFQNTLVSLFFDQ